MHTAPAGHFLVTRTPFAHVVNSPPLTHFISPLVQEPSVDDELSVPFEEDPSSADELATDVVDAVVLVALCFPLVVGDVDELVTSLDEEDPSSSDELATDVVDAVVLVALCFPLVVGDVDELV